MTDLANPDSQPSGDTMRLIREGMIHAEQLARYYLHLAYRFQRLAALLGSIIVGGSLVALFTISSPLPKWVPLTTLIIVNGTILLGTLANGLTVLEASQEQVDRGRIRN